MKRDEIQVIFQNEIDCARLYWVQVSWWQWVPQGLCEERPELSRAGPSQLRRPHGRAQLGLAAKMVGPLGNVFKEGEKIEEEGTQRRREQKGERVQKVLHGARAEVPLQLV